MTKVVEAVSDASTQCDPVNNISGAVNVVLKETVPKSNSRCVTGLHRLTQNQERTVIAVSLIATLAACAAILMVVLLLRHNPSATVSTVNNQTDKDDKMINTRVRLPIDSNTNSTLDGGLKLVSRLEWLAQPPVEPANALRTPVPYVIILHTATENCSSHTQCVFHVRSIQTFHIESRNWWDIGYNFLVGGDGKAYEGRGWKSEGAHTYGYNAKSIGIAFIGSFNSFKPPQRQITACKQLIERGVELGYITKNYKLLAARQLQTTGSPGAALYEDMKTWDHWAKTP